LRLQDLDFGRFPKASLPLMVAQDFGRFPKVIDFQHRFFHGQREVSLMKKMIAILLIGLVSFGTVALAGPGLWKIPEGEFTVDGGPGLWKIPEGY